MFAGNKHQWKYDHFPRCNQYKSFPAGSVVKNLPANAGDVGSIPGSGRSPGEVNGSRLQYSCLENPMNRGAGQATVHGVAEESNTTGQTKQTKQINTKEQSKDEQVGLEAQGDWVIPSEMGYTQGYNQMGYTQGDGSYKLFQLSANLTLSSNVQRKKSIFCSYSQRVW